MANDLTWKTHVVAQKRQPSVFILTEKQRGGESEDLHKARPLQVSNLASHLIWFPLRINELPCAPRIGTIPKEV